MRLRNLQRTIKPFKSPTKAQHCLLLLAPARHWLKVVEVTAQRNDVVRPAPPDSRLWQNRVSWPCQTWGTDIQSTSFLSPSTPAVPDPHPSLWLPPCGCCRQDVQPDHRPVPLQGWRHWHHLQPLRQRLPAEPLPHRPLHQWVTNAHRKILVTGIKTSRCQNLWPLLFCLP